MTDERSLDSDRSGNFENKLRNLKKELKCWESMFFRSHGRKPGKDDISEAGNEIRATYKEYFYVRSKLGETPTKEICPGKETEKSFASTPEKQKQIEDSCLIQSSGGVFGAELNKSHTKTSAEKNSGHLKDRSISKKSFVSKRHLRNPLEKRSENEDSNKQVEKEIKPVLDKKFASEDPTNSNLNQENMQQDVKITSSEKTQSVKFRKLTQITPRSTGALSRNYQLSKEWLERYNPKIEEIPQEQIPKKSILDAESLPSSTDKHNSVNTSMISNEEQFSNISVCDWQKTVDMESNLSAKDIDKKTLESVEKSHCEHGPSEKPAVIRNEELIKISQSVHKRKDDKIKNDGQRNHISNCLRESDQVRSKNMPDKFEFEDAADDSFSIKTPTQPLKQASRISQTAQRKRKATETCKEELSESLASRESKNPKASEERVAKKPKIENTKLATENKKIPSGKRLVSENFVRIDITKKRFCRGIRRVKASTYKRQQWKKKTQFNVNSSSSSSKSTAKCFKCGKEGHWAKECAKKSFRGNMDRGSTFDGKKNEDFRPIHESDADKSCASFSLADVPDLPRCWPRIPYQPPVPPSNVAPLFEPVNGQPSQDAISEVNKALRQLGYNSFRHGQESTVARIVSGLSTLLVLSTGSGKSLCYQLPAYLYYKRAKHLTIVISPLVALMEDQVGNLPYGLKGACFHNNMTKQQREKVMRDLTDGKIAILLLSPEALVSGSAATGYMPMLGGLPPIAFACIDEAHCVSEWSHNFRPNYLRVCKVLREQLGVRCLLGLTATATKSTSISITKHLLINEGDSVGAIIRGEVMPDNLHLTVSRDDDRDRALVQLLSGPRFEKCISIIIYCTRREETERLSSMLRTCLQNLPPTELEDDKAEETIVKEKPKRKGAKSKKPKIMSVLWDAECYHAGMTPAQRRRVQKRFMSGELRIVVATTAFGMGLDKSDVRAIIHYNMPKSFESFLQEVGRAGRDGLPAHCHVFLDDEAKDLCELRRHTYSNSVDNKSVKRLVNRIFRTCDCKERSLEHTSKDQKNNRETSTALCSASSFRKTPETICETNDFLDDLKAEDFEDFDQGFNQSSTRKSHDEPMVVGDEDHATGKQQDEVTASGNPSDVNPSSAQSSCQDEKAPNNATRQYCAGHHVAFSMEDAVQDLDMPEENIATLLSYLELHPDSMIKLMNPVRSMCTVKCYGGPNQMKILAKKFMPMTAVFNNLRRNKMSLSDSRCISFDIVEVADEMGWDLDIVYRELRSIQWNTQFSLNTGDSSIGKSGIMVEFGDMSCHVISPGDLTDDERDNVCQILSDRIKDQEQTRILQLDALYNTLSRASHDTYHAVASNHDPAADKQLRESVGQYFECDPAEMKVLLRKLAPHDIEIAVPECKWSAISRDVRTMIGLHHDVTFTGRALARIFHGINSPCFPAIVWGRDRRFWRRYLDVDFNELRKFIIEEIIQYRS